jgi:hypothetical protein
MKLKLIIKETYFPENLRNHWLEPLFHNHFDISYNLNDDGIVYADYNHYEWAKSLNRPAVIDHLWDPWYNLEMQDTNILKNLRSDGWFCIANECLWYKKLGYDSYTRNSSPNKTFLMPINIKKPHREMLWKQIQPHLEHAVYSYNAKGIQLPDDISSELGEWQRYINPKWFDSTMYSVVVESDISVCHTEKTLRPCAFKHPFVVWARPGHLKWLRTWGFNTFSNIIDESYDLEPDDNRRLTMLIEQIAFLNKQEPSYFTDPETLKRLDHNYNRFYDVEWAEQQFEDNLFNTIKKLRVWQMAERHRNNDAS